MDTPEEPTTRQRNLKALIAQWGGAAPLAKKLGYSNASYISHMVTGYRPITEKTARSIEKKLGLNTGWMDDAHDTEKRNGNVTLPVQVDTELFVRVVSAVSSAMREMGVQLSVEKFEDVVSLVYESGEVDEATIKKYLRLAK